MPSDILARRAPIQVVFCLNPVRRISERDDLGVLGRSIVGATARTAGACRVTPGGSDIPAMRFRGRCQVRRRGPWVHVG